MLHSITIITNTGNKSMRGVFANKLVTIVEHDGISGK